MTAPDVDQPADFAPGCTTRRGLPIPKRLRNAGDRAREKAPGNPSRRRIERALKCERKLRAKMVNAYDAGRRKPLRRCDLFAIIEHADVKIHVHGQRCQGFGDVPTADD